MLKNVQGMISLHIPLFIIAAVILVATLIKRAIKRK